MFEDKESFATGQLNFEYVDQVIDFLLDLAVKIYFEFPGRKKKWIIYIGKEIKRKQQKLSEISMDEWLIMLDAFLKHVIHRYSVAVVSEWMFELWMDAEDVTQVKAYQEFYEKSYKVIKRNLYDAQIGGCNVNCEAGKDALKSNFLFWKNRKCFPDFLTIMSYPYVVESSEDGEIQLNSICSDAHFVLEDIQEYEVLLKNCDCPQRPILMEWNTSLSERNFYNDSCAKACHMVRQMIDASVKGIKLYYNNLSDLTFQYYDAKGPIIGASGLITKDGIWKPAFYVNEFWKKLGNRLLAYGDNYIVTTQMEGSIHLLVHNAKPFNTDYQTKQESQIHIEELRTFFQNDHTLYVKFLIDSVKNKSYHVQKLSIKENEGSLLGEWANLGKSINLSREEITYIKNMTIPRMEVESQPVKDNQIEICLEIGANEVILVNIY